MPPDTERLSASDAYLVAFAQTAGIGVVSFDAGLRQYAGLELTLLK